VNGSTIQHTDTRTQLTPATSSRRERRLTRGEDSTTLFHSVCAMSCLSSLGARLNGARVSCVCGRAPGGITVDGVQCHGGTCEGRTASGSLCVAQWRDRCRCATEARALRRARTVHPCRTAASEQRAMVARPPPECPPPLIRGEMNGMPKTQGRARYVMLPWITLPSGGREMAALACIARTPNAFLRGDRQVKNSLSTILSEG